MSLSDKMLPGKCPACGGNDAGCSKCGGSGTVAFGFPKNAEMWTRHCDGCGQDNGMKMRDESSLDTHLHWDPTTTPGICVFCRSPNTRWLLVGNTDD